MTYLVIHRTSDPRKVGGRGYSQVERIDRHSPTFVNEMLANHLHESLNELSEIEYGLRYDAKITDIITGIMFLPSLWFVNLRFLSLFDKHKIAQYHLQPAILKHRKKYLEDYFLFQFALGIEDQAVDFEGSEYIIEYQFPERQIHCPLKIQSYKDYEHHQDQIRNEYGKLIVTDLKFRQGLDYDFFYIRSFGLGFLASERFADSIHEHNITGIIVSEIERGPYHRLV